MNDPLPSWNDTGVKEAILDFVQAVSSPASQDFVPPGERIATFDNDGTLWLEKPLYIQLQFALHAIGKAAFEHPELREQQPYKAVIEKDMVWLSSIGSDYTKGDPRRLITLMSAYLEAFEGLPVEVFDAAAREFLEHAQHPRFQRPYKQLTYRPMLELVHLLQANDFQVYITTGGGRDFVRSVSQDIYNIPPAMTIGSSITFQYAEDEQGVAQVLRTKELEQPVDDGPGKPAHIHRTTGRRPIMAVGNSNGDIHMLKYSAGHAGRTLSLLLRHDDPECEYAYDEGSEMALQLASKEGWIVVSMKNDWKAVFAPAVTPERLENVPA